MIRINLAPAKRRKPARGTVAVSAAAGGGQWWLLGMIVGWLVLVGVGAWLVMVEEDAVADLRSQTSELNKQLETIRKDIKEDDLQAKKDQVEQLETAIDSLKQKQRTPVYVMHELSMVLTDADKGGGPDVDLEKQRRLEAADPANRLNDRWDTSGVWIDSLKENNDILHIEGKARDAADLSEFVRRLRASARFGDVSRPDFQRTNKPDERTGSRHLTWSLNVTVHRWD